MKKFKLFKPSDIGLASLAITFVLASGLVEPSLFSGGDEPAPDTASDYKKEFCHATNAKIRESLAQSTTLHLDDGQNTLSFKHPKIFVEISYGGTPSETRDMAPEESPVCWAADTYFFEYNAPAEHRCIEDSEELDDLLNTFNIPAQLQVIEESGTIHALVTASDKAGTAICASTQSVIPLISHDF